jgi:transcriptional regulator with XRE-family HTH domain
MSRGTVDLDKTAADRLGKAIAHRRVAMGYRSARSLARETGLDYRTITSIESGQPRAVDRNTLIALEVGLNWSSGTIDGIISENAIEPTDLTLTLSEAVSADIVIRAREIAQATFDAYVRTNRTV